MVLAAIARPSVSTITTAAPESLTSMRAPKRRSCQMPANGPVAPPPIASGSTCRLSTPVSSRTRSASSSSASASRRARSSSAPPERSSA